MRASEKYWQAIALTRKCARYCGADIADVNYRMNILTYFVITCITIYFVFSFYTIYVKISSSWHVILEALCMAGSVVQGITKLMSGIWFRRDIQRICRDLGNIYAEHENNNETYQLRLGRIADVINRTLKILAMIYLFTLLPLATVPIGYLVLKGEKIFVMQFLIPGIDPTTDIGHAITSAIHSTCLFFGAFGNYAGDMFFVLFILHTKLFSDIFELKIEDLNNIVVNGGKKSEVQANLLSILRWHQYYFWYNETVNQIVFWIVFVQIVTSSFSISLTVFIVVTGAWPAGYCYCVYSFCTLFSYCIVGTVADITNDVVLEHIYEIKWYEMHCNYQKMLQIMLIQAQNPTMPTVGGIVPLSVSTGLQVTKTIYSYMMMLLSFLD